MLLVTVGVTGSGIATTSPLITTGVLTSKSVICMVAVFPSTVRGVLIAVPALVL